MRGGDGDPQPNTFCEVTRTTYRTPPSKFSRLASVAVAGSTTAVQLPSSTDPVGGAPEVVATAHSSRTRSSGVPCASAWLHETCIESHREDAAVGDAAWVGVELEPSLIATTCAH